jgi:hypothetical protein
MDKLLNEGFFMVKLKNHKFWNIVPNNYKVVVM